jgi:transcriptional regulator with XRE-family HTH domain
MTLEKFRSDHGLSFEQLAELLGVEGQNPARTVQRYARHERIPPWPMMRLIETKTEGKVTRADFPDAPVRPGAQPPQDAAA